MIYKIVPAALWRDAEAARVFTGTPVDHADGFIHFSAAEQVAETAARHFAGRRDLLLVAVDPEPLGAALKWELSRGGARFPHLYAPLCPDAVRWVRPLPLNKLGEHEFAGLVPWGRSGRSFGPCCMRSIPNGRMIWTLRALAALPAAAPRTDDPCLAVEAFGLKLANPVGLAAGFDKNGMIAHKASDLGFGFAEIGTLTPKAQNGNPKPRLFRLPDQQGVVNSFGFNNLGHAYALGSVRKGTGVLGVNVGANKDAVDRVADYVAGIRAFVEIADYFTINISSPNTPGLRDLQKPDALDELLVRVLDARNAKAEAFDRKPVLLKIAPDLGLDDLDGIVRVARARGVDGMIVSNTTISRPVCVAGSKYANKPGGLSGRPLFALSTWMLAQTYLRVEGQFPLVGVGGIDSGTAALQKLEAGATLIQLYSALVFKGPALVDEIKQALVDAVATGESLISRVGSRAAEWSQATV